MADRHGNYGVLGACGIRVASLDSAGKPVAGAHGYFSKQTVTADIGSTLSKGDSLELKNGCGGIAQTSTTGDTLQNATLKLVLAVDDPILMSVMLGGSQIFTDSGGAGAGDAVGWQAPSATYSDPGCCVELYTKVWDSTQQATPPFLGSGVAAYKVYVFPRTRVQFTSLKLENNFGQVGLDGTSTENTSITANGPFDDWPTDISGPGGITRAFGWYMVSAATYNTLAATPTNDFSTVISGS